MESEARKGGKSRTVGHKSRRWLKQMVVGVDLAISIISSAFCMHRKKYLSTWWRPLIGRSGANMWNASSPWKIQKTYVFDYLKQYIIHILNHYLYIHMWRGKMFSRVDRSAFLRCSISKIQKSVLRSRKERFSGWWIPIDLLKTIERRFASREIKS